MQLINLVINSCIQVILVSIVPLVWWYFKGKCELSFFEWIGLKKVLIDDDEKSKYQFTFLGIILTFSIISIFVLKLVSDNPNLATAQFKGRGLSTLFPVLVYSFIQTGLSEEIFFRGFLTKRLINKFDFNKGNAIQATLFGLMHGAMFITVTNLYITILIILLTGLIGWFLGMINEKLSNGSIISSWTLHGIANVISCLIAMFNLV